MKRKSGTQWHAEIQAYYVARSYIYPKSHDYDTFALITAFVLQ
jgi:hypothetical protein